MVRATKSSVEKTASQTTSSVKSTPAAPVQSTEKSDSAPTTKPRSKKPKAEPVVQTVSETQSQPVVEEVSAPVVAVAANDSASIPNKMTEFSAKLQQLLSLFNTVRNDYKTLEKVVNREIKIAQKASSKKRRSNVNRKPSGFIKPTRISDELAAFLGKTVGTEMARTEVSREINTYIHSNGLQDKSNGRKINPDDKLTKLLKLNKEDELTYFNLQRYMKHHFIKAEVVAAAVSASV
jgi:chromatin remodeling complex protein RSC6